MVDPPRAKRPRHCASRPLAQQSLGAGLLCCTGQGVRGVAVPQRKKRAPLPDIADVQDGAASSEDLEETIRVLHDGLKIAENKEEVNAQPLAHPQSCDTLHTVHHELRVRVGMPDWEFPALGVSASQVGGFAGISALPQVSCRDQAGKTNLPVAPSIPQ